MIDAMASDGAELIHQLTTPEYQPIARQAVPPQFDVPNEPDHPLFLQVDFGLVREPPGQIAPRLVEIQAFPSLYAYQPVLSQVYIDAYGLDPNLRYLRAAWTSPVTRPCSAAPFSVDTNPKTSS